MKSSRKIFLTIYSIQLSLETSEEFQQLITKYLEIVGKRVQTENRNSSGEKEGIKQRRRGR